MGTESRIELADVLASITPEDAIDNAALREASAAGAAAIFASLDDLKAIARRSSANPSAQKAVLADEARKLGIRVRTEHLQANGKWHG